LSTGGAFTCMKMNALFLPWGLPDYLSSLFLKVVLYMFLTEFLVTFSG
jgi:hypothetical protein